VDGKLERYLIDLCSVRWSNTTFHPSSYEVINMGGRYWISGTQIGTLLALLKKGKVVEAKELIDQVESNQFIENTEGYIDRIHFQ